MHCCEFCSNEFLARPQVKKPRACNECQSQRQRANEKAWHARHTHFNDKYHRIRRDERNKRIEKLVLILVECLRVGQQLMGTTIKFESFSDYFVDWFSRLGVRRINKFWSFKNDDEFESLAERLLMNLAQTSSS
jgi:hypothetical protein